MRSTKYLFLDPDKSDYWKTYEKPLRVLGWFLLLLGIGTVLLYGQTYRLTCNRQTGGSVDCSGQIFWFGTFALSRPESIDAVVRAEPAIHCDSVGWNYKYECEFNELSVQSAVNAMDIGANFLNTQTAIETADRINEFLGEPSSQALIITNQNNWLIIQGLVCVTPPLVLLGMILIWGQRMLIRKDHAAQTDREQVTEQ